MAAESIVQGGGTLTQPYGCTAWGLANRSEWNCPERGCGPFGFHAGIDYAARSGTPLTAVGYGRVIQIGRLGGYCGGLGAFAVGIQTGGYVVWYGHCAAALVRPGDLVTPGLVVALMGSRGCSTGTHVHFEVLPLGASSGCASVDPAPFLSSWPGPPPVTPPGIPPPGPLPGPAAGSKWAALAAGGILLALAARRS